ncbi:MAG: pantoate--beta-alanine ligase [Sphingobacteriales bacterium]|nr:MAG: pantoate--beta-alanine ligase [Sphingobacteriales bacterium]TAF80548.1 MAG: pantoate--beta-alanine ligase [Sphingobacteriales bacterium]
MEVFTKKITLYHQVLKLNAEHKSIGLVPTMGALHAGHLSLIKKSKFENDVTIVSIFVNPTQFNDASDLQKYPRPIQTDMALLKNAGCDILFLPSENEMYSPSEKWDYEVGAIANDLEGVYRPGHFMGVTQIVYKLFTIIPAQKAYFGQKDYQQFLVIKHLVAHFNIPMVLVCCPIVREADGLALSSRNIHLSEPQRKKALLLHKTLSFIKNNYSKLPIDKLLQKVRTDFETEDDVQLEYIAFRDKYTLKPIVTINKAIVLIAAQVGNTRLIDNIMLD